MSDDVSLRCACGALHGTAMAVSSSAGTRIVCYCADCQAFARFLGRPDITDPWGGTDIYQMAPGRVRISDDDNALACVRLSDKGMHRWYCRVCKTPVGNTMAASVPFVGLIRRFMDSTNAARTVDELLGPPIAYTQTASALGSPSHPGGSSLVRVILRSVRLVGTWWITKAGHPSPFFNDKTGAPRVEPRVLHPDERRAL